MSKENDFKPPSEGEMVAAMIVMLILAGCVIASLIELIF